MKNRSVGRYEAEDISAQVRKILKGVGNPEPPLDLREVRELLRLDRQYYSSRDNSAAQEFISRLKIAGKQLFERPTLVWDVIKKAQLSALWVPDRKRILIDEETPELKKRWAETHETGHSIIPWHQEFLFGDSEQSLNPACHEKLENEANFAASGLLFMLNRFSQEANDSPVEFSSVKKLSKKFGNTMTSTLWRFVEHTHSTRPLIGIVSVAPNRIDPDSFDPLHPCRYCIESAEFKRQFSGVSEQELFNKISAYCRVTRPGPLGQQAVILSDDNGGEHIFIFDSFWNGYDLLTLGVQLESRKPLVSVSSLLSTMTVSQ